MTYSYVWTPTTAGDFEFRARWDGDDAFAGLTTYPEYHRVLQAYTEVDIEIPDTIATYGSDLSIAGSISPAMSVPMYLELWNSSSWTPLLALQSGEDGSFSTQWQVDFTGTTLLRASWEGDVNYYGGSSDAVIIYSERASSSLSLAAKPTQAEPNQSVSLTGRISPPLEVTVTIMLTRPSGDQTQMISITNVTGDYTTQLNPEQIGEWRMTASWEGNHVYMGCDSGELTLEVAIHEGLSAFLILLLGATVARSFYRTRFENSR
jgi:hypothetical protein